jgi:hypothetical protein
MEFPVHFQTGQKQNKKLLVSTMPTTAAYWLGMCRRFDQNSPPEDEELSINHSQLYQEMSGGQR